jgi:hypothetical protein
MTLSQVKAALAMKAMDIRATQDLVERKASAEQLPKPPVEPPGRAQSGHSFVQ